MTVVEEATVLQPTLNRYIFLPYHSYVPIAYASCGLGKGKGGTA